MKWIYQMCFLLLCPHLPCKSNIFNTSWQNIVFFWLQNRPIFPPRTTHKIKKSIWSTVRNINTFFFLLQQPTVVSFFVEWKCPCCLPDSFLTHSNFSESPNLRAMKAIWRASAVFLLLGVWKINKNWFAEVFRNCLTILPSASWWVGWGASDCSGSKWGDENFAWRSGPCLNPSTAT